MRTRSILPAAWPLTRRLALVATLAAVLVSCGRKYPDTAPVSAGSPAQSADSLEEYDQFASRWPMNSEVPVEIQNNHKLDLTIYVVRSGKFQRVAMAIAARSTYLRLPSRHLGPGNELLLMAHAIGAGRRLQSDRMVVMPGQRVVWTIDNGFRNGSAAVWE